MISNPGTCHALLGVYLPGNFTSLVRGKNHSPATRNSFDHECVSIIFPFKSTVRSFGGITAVFPSPPLPNVDARFSAVGRMRATVYDVQRCSTVLGPFPLIF